MSTFGNWGTGLVEWQADGVAYLSVVFSWQLQRAYQRAVWLDSQGFHVRVGGPAVAYQPDYLTDVAEIGGSATALVHHNRDATFTSRGCPRRCPFCIVPAIEGDLVELDDWEPKPIVCDNNLLACSWAHFDRVIDSLKPLKGIDFNQGLDARLLTLTHARRLIELDLRCIRLAWDFVEMEPRFVRAVEILRDVGFPTNKIRVYVLIGYKDTPEDALYRLQTIREIGLWPNPMRFQPLNTERRNAYVGEGWTHRELDRYMVYWSQLRRLGGVPFAEFRRDFKKDVQSPAQISLPGQDGKGKEKAG